jgi:hypothetical protein
MIGQDSGEVELNSITHMVDENESKIKNKMIHYEENRGIIGKNYKFLVVKFLIL